MNWTKKVSGEFIYMESARHSNANLLRVECGHKQYDWDCQGVVCLNDLCIIWPWIWWGAVLLHEDHRVGRVLFEGIWCHCANAVQSVSYADFGRSRWNVLDYMWGKTVDKEKLEHLQWIEGHASEISWVAPLTQEDKNYFVHHWCVQGL